MMKWLGQNLYRYLTTLVLGLMVLYVLVSTLPTRVV